MFYFDKVIEFCCGYFKFLCNYIYVFIISMKLRDKWYNFFDFLNDVIVEEYSVFCNERRIVMKWIFLF